MTVALFTSTEAMSEEVWKRVFYNDFGGNSATDDLFGPELDASETFGYDYDETCRYGYCVLKHFDHNENWYNGGDHTFPDNRETGYYLLFNPDNQAEEIAAYRTKLEGLCRGVTFRFTAWVANLVQPNKSGSSNLPKLALGVFEGENPEVLVSPKAHLEPQTIAVSQHDVSNQALHWEKVSIDFELNSNLDYAYFIVTMVQPESNGWDFAIDDISIEVLQPQVGITHSEIFYHEPLTLSASFDNNGFFADMNNVEYCWEYSKNGVDYQQIKRGKYTDDKSLSYTIDNFDKDQNNGYYRVRIGENGVFDSPVCSLEKEFQINETTVNKKVTLCAGERKVMDDGMILDANNFNPDGVNIKKNDANGVVYYITVKKTKQVKLEDEYICVNAEVYMGRAQEYNGQTFTEIKDIPYTRVYKDDAGCIDSTESWTISVSGPRSVVRKDLELCQGKKGYDPNKVYDTPGYFSEDDEDETQSCIRYIYNVTVYPTYSTEETHYLCQGDSLNGKVYGETGGPFYDTKVYKTKESKDCGCDSIVNYTIYVTGKTYTDLEPVTKCYGESYEFDGKTYSDPGTYTLEKVFHTSGCDSVVTQKLTILDRLDNKDNPIDTLICYDSKLFGVTYPEPTTTPILVRDPETHVSSTGCDSIVWFNLTVLQIQLKLEIKSDRNTVCRGEEVEIYIKELKPKNVPYAWFPELGGSSTTKKVFTPTGDLDCVVRAERVIDATSTCVSTDTIHVYVREAPILSVDSIDQKENMVAYSVTGGTEPYQILLDKNVISSDPSGELHDSPIGTHKLVATDANDCSDAAYFDITPVPVTPAEYFTPNGDGLNDRWTIENIDVYPKCNVKIYDRSGRLVANIDSYDNEEGWDGKYMGHPLPSTDYWYLINLPESDIQLMGHFTLLR